MINACYDEHSYIQPVATHKIDHTFTENDTLFTVVEVKSLHTLIRDHNTPVVVMWIPSRRMYRIAHPNDF